MEQTNVLVGLLVTCHEWHLCWSNDMALGFLLHQIQLSELGVIYFWNVTNSCGISLERALGFKKENSSFFSNSLGEVYQKHNWNANKIYNVERGSTITIIASMNRSGHSVICPRANMTAILMKGIHWPSSPVWLGSDKSF